MPRPVKCRRVCALPRMTAFHPESIQTGKEPVVLTVDEYETIRIIDWNGASQEACGHSMQVARATVQQIYLSARRKLAAALVEGRPIQIQGGTYRLCDGRRGCNGCRCLENTLAEQQEDSI